MANLLSNIVRGLSAGLPAYQQGSQFVQQMQMQAQPQTANYGLAEYLNQGRVNG